MGGMEAGAVPGGSALGAAGGSGQGWAGVGRGRQSAALPGALPGAACQERPPPGSSTLALRPPRTGGCAGSWAGAEAVGPLPTKGDCLGFQARYRGGLIR